jgi:transcription antitermination factor NusG
MGMARGQISATWIVLQCASSKTIALASSFADRGAWTPVEQVHVGPKNGIKREPVSAPITPGYVFVPATELCDLLDISRNPAQQHQVWDSEARRMVTKGFPYFRVVRGNSGEFALTPDKQLDVLRIVEMRSKRKPRGAVKAIPKGTMVRMTEGGFEGMEGRVDEIEGKYALVVFDGFPCPVKIGMWMLQQALDDSARFRVGSGNSDRSNPFRSAA